MAINVDFYTFSKKSDSTKLPSSNPETFPCNLMEPTSVTAPNITLIYQGNPTKYNYAFISDFGRFYFVNDWTHISGRWTATLSVDVLASWKAYIGEAEEYVLRSAAEYDENIVDTLYPSKTDVVTEVSVSASEENLNPFVSKFEDGRFIVGIVNSDNSAIGTVSYYSFTNSQFRSFCNALMSDATWFLDGITEIGDELAKCLFNPFQYIASCMWFPTRFAGTGVSEIHYGWWRMPCSATRLTSTLSNPGVVFNIPDHPQIERGAYLNKSVFSRYTLTWPVFGTFPLPAELVGGEKVTCQCYVDAISGSGTLVAFTNGATLFSTQVSVGVPIQISQMSQNVYGTATSAISAVSSVLKGNIGGMFNSIGDAVSNALPQLSTKGSNGSGSAFMFNPSVECEFFKIADEDLEHRGRPLMQKRKIKNLPGYILCSDADIEIPCTNVELNEIVNKMNGGFYYE